MTCLTKDLLKCVKDAVEIIEPNQSRLAGHADSGMVHTFLLEASLFIQKAEEDTCECC